MNNIHLEGVRNSLPFSSDGSEKDYDASGGDWPLSERAQLANAPYLEQKQGTVRFHPSRNRPKLYVQNESSWSFQSETNRNNALHIHSTSYLMSSPNHITSPIRLKPGHSGALSVLIPIGDDADEDAGPQDPENDRNIILSSNYRRILTTGIEDTSRNINTLNTQANLNQQTIPDQLIRHRESLRGNRNTLSNSTRNQSILNASIQMEMRAHQESIDVLRQRVLVYVIMFAIYIQGLLVLKRIFSYRVSFSIFWVCCLYHLLSVLRNKSNVERTTKQKRKEYCEVLESFTLALFLAAVLLKVEGITIYLIPFVAFGLALFAFSFIYFQIYSNCSPINTIHWIKLMGWIQLLLIALKADNVIEQWEYVFYPSFYVSFIFMSGSIIFLIMSICYLILQYRSVSFRGQVLGHLWDFFNSLSSWAVGFSLLGLIRLIESEDETILFITLIAGSVHSLGLIAFTLCLNSFMQKYILLSLMARERIKLRKSITNQKFQIIKENISYLVQISPNYFVKMTDKSRIKEKQLIEQLQKNIEIIKTKGQNMRELRKTELRNIKKCLLEGQPKNVIDMTKKMPNQNPGESKSLTKMRSRSLIMDKEALNVRKNRNVKPQRNNYSLNDLDQYVEKREAQKNKKPEENEKLCFVCFSNAPDAVFMNCGHGGICYDCSLMAWKKDDHCVLCRELIVKIFKVIVYPKVGVARVLQATKKDPFTFV